MLGSLINSSLDELHFAVEKNWTALGFKHPSVQPHNITPLKCLLQTMEPKSLLSPNRGLSPKRQLKDQVFLHTTRMPWYENHIQFAHWRKELFSKVKKWEFLRALRAFMKQHVKAILLLIFVFPVKNADVTNVYTGVPVPDNIMMMLFLVSFVCFSPLPLQVSPPP